VRTLLADLLAEQTKRTPNPYLRVQVLDHAGGIARLHWTQPYDGAEADGPHALAIPTDGSLNRLRVASNVLYRQRVTTPIYGGADPNFGKKTIGGSNLTIPANYKQATKFTLAAATTITAILAYGHASAGTISARALIHADSAGSPGALLATTRETAGIDTTPAWRTFDTPIPINLPAGDYWLGVIVSASATFYFDAGSTDQTAFNTDTYADGPANPFGTPTLRQDTEYSIYATRPTFDTWTSFRTTTARCAIARYGANLLAFAVDSGTPTQIYKAESSDGGATWGAWALLCTAAGTVAHIAAASKTNGDTLVVFAVGATAYKIKRVSAAWGAITAWTNTAATITGLAAHYFLDFNLVIAGTEATTLHPRIWSCIYGDGYSEAPDAWTILRSITEASAGAGVTYSAPALTYADTFRAAYRNAFAGPVAYDRHDLTATPDTADYVDNLWTEPRPFDLDHDYGLALAATATHVWATTPSHVYYAPLPTALDLTDDVLSCIAHDYPLDPRGAIIRLTNHDGRYNNPGQDDLTALSRGARVNIAPGYYTPSGPLASDGPSYYIDYLEHTSTAARRELILHCLSTWGRLAQWKPGRSYRWAAGTRNYFQLISAILTKAGLAFSAFSGTTKMTDDYPDFAIHPGYDPPPYISGYRDTGRWVWRANHLIWIPGPPAPIWTDPLPQPEQDLPFTTALSALATLYSHLEDRVLAQQATVYNVWPQAADASVYSFGAAHPILAANYRHTATPNRFLAIGDADLAAESVDFATVDLLHDRPRVVHDKGMTTAADVTDRADREARDAEIHSRADTIVVPPHCGIELWDVVDVTDATIGLAAVKRRVIGITLDFDRASDSPTYHQVLTLGAP
jgi:hypothetical protein